MKAISLRQPWPWFILQGGKHLENRGWTSSYRGPVLIHSSKGWDEDEMRDDLKIATHIARSLGAVPAGGVPALETLKEERGCIVGVATIVGSVIESDSPWFFGPKAFVLADPIPFVDMVPCRGDRGLFTVPEDVASACRAQIDLARSRR